MKKGYWSLLFAAVLGIWVSSIQLPDTQNSALGQGCTLQLHSHTDKCICAQGLCCGYEDYCVHIHQEICYDASGDLRCDLPQITLPQGKVWESEYLAPQQLHTHTERCFREGSWVCGQKQLTEHIHTQACFAPRKTDVRPVDRDWIGVQAVSINGFTFTGIVLMVLGFLLLPLRKYTKETLYPQKKSLPQL